MNRITRFTNTALSLPGRKKRLHEFKRLILSMPYTSTYYLYQKNPGLFFKEEEHELALEERRHAR